MRTTFFKKNIALVSFTLTSSLLLTACGGGGGGGSSSSTTTDTADVPQSGYRVNRVDLDYDNNGTPDATVAITYDSNGSIASEAYTYTDDGTTDLFKFYATTSDTNEQYDYTHLANGKLSTMDILSNSRRSFSLYSYNTANQLSSVEETVTNGTITGTGQQTTTFSYANGQPASFVTINTSTSQAIVRSNFTYDAENHVQTQALQILQSDGTTWNTQVITTSWTAAGNIAEVTSDTNNDGNANITLAYSYGSDNQLISRVRTNIDDPTEDSTVTYNYTNNIRSGESWDLGSDGSIEATLAISVQSATCQYSYGWRYGATPNFSYSETTDYTPGTGAYRIRACITPGE